jgi:hypothetical protein
MIARAACDRLAWQCIIFRHLDSFLLIYNLKYLYKIRMYTYFRN